VAARLEVLTISGSSRTNWLGVITVEMHWLDSCTHLSGSAAF